MAAVLVNIACGSAFVDGWVNFDYAPTSPAVTRANLLERLPLGDAVADVVYSSHFLEHVPRRHVAGFLADCFRILKPAGMIRLVLPDLDELCREYMRQRDSGAHAKADFVVLELLDQCVRTEPGGELGTFYESLHRSGESDLMAYISGRTGEDFSALPSRGPPDGRERMLRALRHPAGVWAWLERSYCRALTSLLPRAFLEQNVSFAGVGERHAWLYDFHTLSRLLQGAGFVAVQRASCDRSAIEGFPFCPLDVTPVGRPRKGLGSMYVEASKP